MVLADEPLHAHTQHAIGGEDAVVETGIDVTMRGVRLSGKYLQPLESGLEVLTLWFEICPDTYPRLAARSSNPGQW